MYYYTLSDCTSRYYPKVYLGTLGTVSYWWLCNRETDWILDSNTTPKLTWPQAFQGPQKGGGVGVSGGEDDKERIISYFLLESVDTAGSSIRSSSFLLCSFSLSESSFDILM